MMIKSMMNAMIDSLVLFTFFQNSLATRECITQLQVIFFYPLHATVSGDRSLPIVIEAIAYS